jgi:protein-tyrosine phosphatase
MSQVSLIGVISALPWGGEWKASAPVTKPFRILFVCMGNICRSPAAEIIFRRMVADEGLSDRVEIDSAGTIGNHAGAPPDHRMAKVLKARGYVVEGTARQVTAADLANFDLVLAMDDENYADLRATAGKNASKVRKFVKFCTRHAVRGVPDPYFGGAEGFERVVDILEDGCEELLAYLREFLGMRRGV